jgi:hypothetical protein
MKMGKLLIADIEFDVKGARLESFIDGSDDASAKHRFAWGIAAVADRAGQSSDWKPRATFRDQAEGDVHVEGAQAR